MRGALEVDIIGEDFRDAKDKCMKMTEMEGAKKNAP